MSCGAPGRKWRFGKVRVLSLKRVGSIVRDIGDPCLSNTAIKVVIAVSKMLKPDKWQEVFDCDGKVSGFRKVLKLIVLGGVDPSIRAEVWEFLLGCYTLGSTAEYRKQLRTTRRERYEDLLKQCQTMHASVGTGSLAYMVGSKVMDMRRSSTNVGEGEGEGEVKVDMEQASLNSTDKIESYSGLSNNSLDAPYPYTEKGESLSTSADLVRLRGSSDTVTCGSSLSTSPSAPDRCNSLKWGPESHSSEFINDAYLNIASLPVRNLFEEIEEDSKEGDLHAEENLSKWKLNLEDDNMHIFKIKNNADLIMESAGSPSSLNNMSVPLNSEIESVHYDDNDAAMRSNNASLVTESVRIADVLQGPAMNPASSKEESTSNERISEWLWTLHRIVVDVVRTDCHLEFYGDAKNLARMSDILAVYAWVDPATGYCQGMSDLLSPFVVLFEDDADAFWCFEMLIRRTRENFLVEGPTGVMKQLQALWHILELTDREIFSHLSNIGAESLHFAFPMLLVLFRRELSFAEALNMWEMMWAADFDESLACNLADNCLEALVLQLPTDPGPEMRDKIIEIGIGSIKGRSLVKHGNSDDSSPENDGIKSMPADSFCGLTRNFWSKNDRHFQIGHVVSSPKKREVDLPVFCVAAVLIMNRHKIIRETRSIDDMIKIFNDKLLKIHVKSCVHAAIKLRKKYIYKRIKKKTHTVQDAV